jgi:hypothetical protein
MKKKSNPSLLDIFTPQLNQFRLNLNTHEFVYLYKINFLFIYDKHNFFSGK